MALCQLATNQCLFCRLVSTCYNERVSLKKKSLSDEVQLTEEMYEKMLKKFVLFVLLPAVSLGCKAETIFQYKREEKMFYSPTD